jgi:hypothetical protein
MTGPVHATMTILVAVAIAGTLLGCTSSQRASGPEQQLAAAGFQVWYADSPQKLANLEALTQRQLVAHPYDGGIRYVYADADGCKCVYAGNQLAYDEYQKMAAGDKVAGPGVMAAEMNKDAAMDWGVWGP